MGSDFNNFEFLDILTILSFILGIKNYNLNNQQSNVMMHEMQNNQDDMLAKIIAQNEIIIKQNGELLKLGGKHES